MQSSSLHKDRDTHNANLLSVVMRLFYGADELAMQRIVEVLREEVDGILRMAAHL